MEPGWSRNGGAMELGWRLNGGWMEPEWRAFAPLHAVHRRTRKPPVLPHFLRSPVEQFPFRRYHTCFTQSFGEFFYRNMLATYIRPQCPDSPLTAGPRARRASGRPGGGRAVTPAGTDLGPAEARRFGVRPGGVARRRPGGGGPGGGEHHASHRL